MWWSSQSSPYKNHSDIIILFPWYIIVFPYLPHHIYHIIWNHLHTPYSNHFMATLSISKYIYFQVSEVLVREWPKNHICPISHILASFTTHSVTDNFNRRGSLQIAFLRRGPCLGYWGHFGLSRTNYDDDDENRPFYLQPVGKRDGR